MAVTEAEVQGGSAANRAHVARLVGDFAELAAGNLEPRAIAETAVRGTCALLDCAWCALYLWNPDAQTLDCLVDSGPDDADRVASQQVAERVFAAGVLLVDEGVGGTEPIALFSGVSCAAVPLQAGSETIGVLCAWQPAPWLWQQENVDLLTLVATLLAPSLAMARLYENAERGRNTAQALAEMVRVGAAEHNVERVLAMICEQAAGIVGADYSGISLADPDNANGRVRVGMWGARSPTGLGDSEGRGRGPVGRSLRERRTIVREGMNDDPESTSRMHRQEGGKTALATPLIAREDVLGALLLGWRTPVKLTQQQIRLAESLAGYAATILENARTHTQLEQRRMEAQALAELVRDGAMERNPERAIALICEHGRRVVGADYAGVRLMEMDGQRAWHGFSGRHRESWLPTRGRGSGVTAQALATGRTVIVERLQDRPDESHNHQQEGGQTVLCTPLGGWAGLSGTLHLGWRTDVHLTPTQVHVAEALASYAGVIIENAQAHASLEERAATLAASQERLRTFYETLPCGVLVWDRSLSIIQVNPAAAQLLDLPPDQILGQGHDELWTLASAEGGSLERQAQPVHQVLATREAVRNVVVRASMGSGARRWLQMDVVPVLDADGLVQEIVASFIDMTARVQAEQALEREALYDSLTGLPNRRLLHDQLQEVVRSSVRDGYPVALLLLDLDRFKDVNDTLGHDAGDILLQEIGRRLGEALPPTDTVARLGGDEFAILLTDTVSAEAAVLRAEDVLLRIGEPLVLKEHTVQVGGSIGIALCPEHGRQADELLRGADVAMYVAKRRGGGFDVYESGMDRDTTARLTLVQELRRALEHGELAMAYQPTVDLNRGSLAGVEALVRWRHPQRGMILPADFIPLVEQTGLIHDLSHWVLGDVCRQIHSWHVAGLDLNVAVNLTMQDAQNPRLPEEVRALIEQWQVPTGALTIEITESALMSDPPRARTTLQQLRSMGVRIAIDDFGTGYSSLAYLHQLSVDELKVDRSFVSGMAVERGTVAIVRAAIELGHAFGLSVVAEGVEDETTLRMLKNLQCDRVQGYLLSEPRFEPELRKWVSTFPGGIGDMEEDQTVLQV